MTNREVVDVKDGPSIVGVGEVLWDAFPDGEAFGGAPANFVSHCLSQGARSGVISCLGADARGLKARQFLERHGVDTAGLAESSEYPTGVVLVTLDEQGIPEYEIRQGVAWDHIPFTPGMAALCAEADALCFGTLSQRHPDSRATIAQCLAATRPECLRVFDINIRQDYHSPEVIMSSLEQANALKLNDEELPLVAALLGLSGSNEELLRGIVARCDLRLAILTLGPKGALMMTPDDSCFAVPPDDPVVNTVGAGDSFTAATIMGYLRGDALAEINRFANELATFVCTQHGAVPPLPPHLKR